MPQVALSSDFLTAFAEIPKKKQKTVREALEKFKRDPTSAAQNSPLAKSRAPSQLSSHQGEGSSVASSPITARNRSAAQAGLGWAG